MFGKKIVAVLLSKSGDRYEEIKRLKISVQTTTFKVNDRDYIVSLDKVCFYDKKKKPILFYDVNNAEPIPLANMKVTANSRDLHTIIDSKVLEKISKGRGADKWLFFAIFGLIIGIVIVVVYSQYSQSQLTSQIMRLNEKLLNMTQTQTNPYVPLG